MIGRRRCGSIVLTASVRPVPVDAAAKGPLSGGRDHESIQPAPDDTGADERREHRSADQNDRQDPHNSTMEAKAERAPIGRPVDDQEWSQPRCKEHRPGERGTQSAFEIGPTRTILDEDPHGGLSGSHRSWPVSQDPTNDVTAPTQNPSDDQHPTNHKCDRVRGGHAGGDTDGASRTRNRHRRQHPVRGIGYHDPRTLVGLSHGST